jgi:uncharacterized protein (TIGR02118 family)
MIRLTYLLRRKPGMSLEEFQTYWREVHGPLVAGHARRIDTLRYVQVHTLEDEANTAMAAARGGMEPPYDGVAELWWENIEALEAALSSEEGARAGEELLEDERQFIDLPASPLWLNYEYPQVNPSPESIVARPRSTIVKLYFPLRALPNLSEADAQLYWRTNHGPIIRRQAGSRTLRYVQVHRFEHPIEQALRDARGTEVEPYTGHAELWHDRGIQAARSPEGAAAGERAIEDESKFIDFSRSSMWLAKEHVFVDRM